MTVSFQECLSFTLSQEGGWSDNPDDPGGATNHGITLRTFQTFVSYPATKEELRDISMDDVSAIYYQFYWLPCLCYDLPAGLDLMVFDMAVNAGPHRSLMLMQESLGVPVDGIIGPATLLAIETKDRLQVLGRLKMLQQSYYQTISGATHPFLKGWLARLDMRHQKALAMYSEENP